MLRRVAAKDLGAFKALVELYQGRVLGLCARLLNHPQNAEDVAQDVFFQIYRASGTFRHESRVSTWIYRIVVNRCHNFNRDGRRADPLAGTHRGAAYGDADGPDVAAPEEADPAAAWSLNETRAIVRKAVASLPEKQRTMLVLNKFEGRSYREIAEIMDVSLASVESCLHRAKLNLEAELALRFPELVRDRKFGPATRVQRDEDEQAKT
ncbi:MAG TPA: RNA polymerase sigma factor [Candidatus Aminicenantes bacterium]|nr:RNA polymerase sigma factor [Candidatus Aminicenantes bacterium]HRY64376.1 RNA polymerase sigma factor [Candidatus Aminicenantes bacterium]HRZ71289.1 RNA polymerase sigma factor [Candidatus Aminicenantes bacterium]